MFQLLILFLLVVHTCIGEEQNDTQGSPVADSPTEVTSVISSETSRWKDNPENTAAAVVEAVGAVEDSPTSTRGPRPSRRKPRRGGRFRAGNPRYRDQPPYNVYNPYYRVPHTYYDMYYNPYQSYYPEYAQPGYYPPYPYQPQQPYPQPYPYPPPPPVVPTPPPTLAPIPDLYYVQNTDGHYQYRRVSVTKYPDTQQYGYDRRSSRDYRYPPRRPRRPPPPASEFRPRLTLTSAPYQAQVFGVMSQPPTTQVSETTGG